MLLSKTTHVTDMAENHVVDKDNVEFGLHFGDAARPGPVVLILGLVALTQLMVIVVRIFTI